MAYWWSFSAETWALIVILISLILLFFGAYSMDVVTSTAFSVDIDSLNNPKDPFVSNIKKMLKFDLFNPLFLAVALFPFIAPVLEKMDFAFFPTSVTDFFYASLQKIKSERVAKDHKKRVDFMQLMIDSQKSEKDDLNGKETNKGLNDHEILSQSMIFIFAGYETSSSTLSFLFYNLASNPETVKKLQEEIDATFPNKAEVDYDAVMNMDYLDAALNESLRTPDTFLHPFQPACTRFFTSFPHSPLLWTVDPKYLNSCTFFTSSPLISAARIVSPLLVHFKRDAGAFFLPSLRNVEVLAFQLDKYIRITQQICEKMEKKY
ncbi:hypothetical protein PDJAM_G00163210 [Pangasius djambal]|uniref:Uncharacterized protein n=1 Tax=Pangasius djambal TaxID=1691987 RepID=A0ACC5ZJD0_9TELE|nr:hypothetical protein [Pangasius djambal]